MLNCFRRRRGGRPARPPSSGVGSRWRQSLGEAARSSFSDPDPNQDKGVTTANIMAGLRPSQPTLAASTTPTSRPHGCRSHEVIANDVLQSECIVRLQDFNADEALRAMPYSHAFHHHCISEWLSRKASCPLCRRHLPTAPTPMLDEEDDIGRVEWVDTSGKVEWVDGGGGESS
uniref:RING-type domain-containing protein n=1 Tax=Setaria italica TaxID=4555 RepID=K3YL41_SETIT